MKFGIFYELQLPRPWEGDSELELYQNALSQVELADKLGYDYAWMVEHHFLEEYSHCPSPESFLGAASQRTGNIRLGHGILQLTTNHPARVAERVAVLDLLSKGRVRVRHGRERIDHRARALQRSMEDKRDVFEEAVQAIFPMFKDGRQRAPRQVFRHAAAQRRAQAAAEAAPADLGGLLAARDHRARAGDAAWARSASSSSARTPRTPGCTPTTTPSPSGSTSSPTTSPIPTSRWSASSCAPRPTRRRGSAPTAPPSSSSRCGSTAPRADRKRPAPGTVNMWDEYNKWKRANPEAQEAALRGGLIGSPDTIRKKLRQVRDLPHRPGDPAQPGRQEHARGHLRIARAVRQGGDAGVPGATTPSMSVESSR